MINDISYDDKIVKSVFGVVMPKQFRTLKEQLEYTILDSIENDVDDQAELDNVLPIITELIGDDSPIPHQYLNNSKRRDTSLGGNDTINCYPQFHENDDIVYPYTAVGPNGENGLGRVYNETIDSNQQIMHLSFGVAEFNDPASFYLTSINQQLSQLMNKGDAWNIPNLFGLLGKVIGFVITLPLKPFVWTYKLLKGWFSTNATKYYDFKPTMPLYFKIVNTSLATLAVNMGLSEVEEEYLPTDNEAQEYSADYGNETVNKVNSTGKDMGKSNLTKSDGIPAAFSSHGLDIYAILQKTELYDRLMKDGDIQNLEQEIERLKSHQNNDFNFFKSFATGFSTATTESKLYVGFKIEKSTDSSESFSNSVGPSSIAESVNSKVSAMKDVAYTTGNFNIFGLKTIKDSITSFMNGITSNFGVGGIGEALKGNGFLDFPEVWKNSSFSKSYNFTMQLRSIYGDRVSILYNIYIPLLMMFGAALPRATGKQSYTSPFLIRAYSKGLFSVPLGIIDSLSVKRGSPEFGWSAEQFPTSVDISFTIKDLSAALYMGVAGTSEWLNILGQNSSWNEYLLNLGGVSIRDRSLFWSNVKRRAKILNLVARNVKFNPALRGFEFGTNSLPGKIICAIHPISKLPTK